MSSAGTSIDQVERYMVDMGDLVLHLADTWADYAANERYLV